MNRLFERITGFSHHEQVLAPLLLSQTIESQRMRVAQSHRALLLVMVSGIFYIIGLWDEARHWQLLTWIGLISALAVVRVLVCRRVEQSLPFPTVPVLYRNELMLYFSSLASTLTVGSGYWWVGLQGDDRMIFAVAMLTLIYAIGTTVNSSIQNRGFSVLLISNLGQGIVFLVFFSPAFDIETSVAMVAITILLIEFGKKNAAVFADSIRIREENREQNIKLEKDKLIIEKSLNVARQANEEKNRFMAAASHDLRQPLHAMTLFLGSLRHMSADPRMRELIDKIDESSTILHEQFNSLLDLSKFDAGVVTADQMDFRLDLMLKNIADAARQEAQQKNVALHLFTIPMVVRSDMLLMERLLRNLVVNAVRYTDKGSVSIQMRRQSRGLLISIIDTGVGISEEHQQKIFADYYQLNNKARSKGKGSGLGLAIVKRIASLLTITITLKSQLGAGSNFGVHLPANCLIEMPELPQTESSTVVEAVTDLEGVRVLVVDDDAAVVDAMVGLLRSWGCSALSATSPNQVDRLLLSHTDFDLILLDDMLDNDFTGLDIALELIDSLSLAKSRIIMVTGNVTGARLAEIREAGFEVLAKPVDSAVLRRAIGAALSDRI